MLSVTEIVPVAPLTMPWKVVTAVVVPLMPMAMEFAVAVLPIVFVEMVKLPAVPAVWIPAKA